MNLSPEEIVAYVTAVATAIGLLTAAVKKAKPVWADFARSIGLGQDENLHDMIREVRDSQRSQRRDLTNLSMRVVLLERRQDALWCQEETLPKKVAQK